MAQWTSPRTLYGTAPRPGVSPLWRPASVRSHNRPPPPPTFCGGDDHKPREVPPDAALPAARTAIPVRPRVQRTLPFEPYFFGTSIARARCCWDCRMSAYYLWPSAPVQSENCLAFHAQSREFPHGCIALPPPPTCGLCHRFTYLTHDTLPRTSQRPRISTDEGTSRGVVAMLVITGGTQLQAPPPPPLAHPPNQDGKNV